MEPMLSSRFLILVVPRKHEQGQTNNSGYTSIHLS